jgi:hypothetical protein
MYYKKEHINMVSRLSMVGRLVLALLAVFVFGGLAASMAQAEGPTEPLRWQVEGKVLKANETREITITKWNASPPTNEPIVLEGGALKVSCEVAKAGPNPFLANQANGAVAITSPEFEKCTTEGNGEGCTVNEPVQVKQTRGEGVLSDNLPGVGKKVLAEFDPVTGEVFAALGFTGSKCKLTTIEVGKGLVLGSFFSDPLAFGGTTAEQLEIEGTVGAHNNAETEAKSVLLKFPDAATSVYLWSSTEWKLLEFKQFKAGTNPATLKGNFLILLAKNGKSTGETFSTVK